MAPRRRKQDSSARNFLIGSVVFFILAAGGLVFALTAGRGLFKREAKGNAVAPSQPSGPVAGRPDPDRRWPDSGQGVTPADTPAEKPIALKAEDLRQQVARDETAVEKRYKNKLLDVTGTVGSVIKEDPLIALLFGQPRDPVAPVMCDLDRQQSGLDRLQPGQTITIRGIYLGKTAEGFIGMGNCRIVGGGR
jgi:hypothetical protein